MISLSIEKQNIWKPFKASIRLMSLTNITNITPIFLLATTKGIYFKVILSREINNDSIEKQNS